jgi:octaprenyl-diphosphate synthase
MIGSIKALHRIAGSEAEGKQHADALARAQELVGGALLEMAELVTTLTAGAPRPARDAIEHLIGSGGKRLRPLLTLLSARAAGGAAESAAGCAVAAELVHSATLLHDDVIDDGRVRRGRPAARVLWGNTISVLSGDLLLVTALRQMEHSAPSQARIELIDTMGALVEGEVIQLDHRGRLDLDAESYERIIQRKTASLFRWCARAGGHAAGGGEAQIEALGRFGHHVGMAFQLRDDVLDLWGDDARTGKALAADLVEGKLTLPVIIAMEREPGIREVLRRLAQPEHGDLQRDRDRARVVASAQTCGGLEATHERMAQELAAAREALAPLPGSEAARLLGSVADALHVRDR